jgi:hypothetical protein
MRRLSGKYFFSKGFLQRTPSRFIKADQQLFAFANDRAAQQIRLGLNEFKQFLARRQRLGEPTFLVNRMARIQKGREVIIPKDGFEFCGSQRLFGVIALNQICFAYLFAQETPRVAASSSGAF